MKTFSIKPSEKETLNYISCPVCGGDLFSPHWNCDSFSFVRCRTCHLVMQNPQPAFEDLDKRYDDEYFKYEQDNDRSFFELMIKGLDDAGFDPHIGNSESNLSFLDVGCATGLLVEYMQDKGWNSKGVELCGPAAVYGSEQRKIEIFSGVLEQAAYGNNTFDVIHCSHLIEHLNDPSAYLDEIYRILKPGGFFYCTTPNSDGFQARVFGSKWRSAIADHMFLFSRKTLVKLLVQKSFSVEKIGTWGGIGQGYAPSLVKKMMDRYAKKLHFGDVMIISSRKI